MAELLSLKMHTNNTEKHEIIYLKPTEIDLSGFPSIKHSDEEGRRNFSKKNVLPSLPEDSSLFIRYENISYIVSGRLKRNSKCILNYVNGKINFGEFVAILGPSGSGKTSLMNILSGYKDIGSNRKQITGRILINGKERNIKQFRTISSYVMQDDCLFTHFTVLETMVTAANLKVSEETPMHEKKKMISEILENLGLLHCQNTRILNISGGERKRLCIGLELLRDPLVMFFDEPTSGLDSTSCNQIISLLKSLTHSGRTIICTIHHPSSKVLNHFDKLVIMAEGQCVYNGLKNNLVPFLSSMSFYCPSYYNPADFVLDIITMNKGKYVPNLINAVKNGEVNGSDNCNTVSNNDCLMDSINSNETVLKKFVEKENRKQYATSNWSQFKILFVRASRSAMRDKWLMEIRLMVHLLTGILIGLLYFNVGNQATKAMNNIAGLHFSQVFLMMTNAMLIVIQFPIERKIIQQEQINNWYNLRNYYFAATTADLPFQIVFTLIFSTIYYWMSSQPEDLFRYIYYVALSSMTTLISISFGLIFGAGANIEIAVFLGIIFSVPIMAFTGFFVRVRVMPTALRWMASVSYLAYAFEGIMIAIYGYNREKLECNNDFCIFPTPKLLLAEIGITNTQIYIDFLFLFAIFLVFRLLIFFILRWKLKI